MDSKSLVFLAKDNLDFAKLGLKTSSDFKKFKSDPTLENTDFPKNVSNWSLYVIPIFTVLHRLFLYPHTIRYDPEQRKCLKHNGSLPRRVKKLLHNLLPIPCIILIATRSYFR